MDQEKLERYFRTLEEVNQKVVRRIHKAIGEQDLRITVNQVMVLDKIYKKERMTVSEVADDLGISLSAITALVDRLCKSNYLERRRDENDRRLVWLELTPEGKETVEICIRCRDKEVGDIISKLDEEDLDELLRINEKLVDILRAEEQG